MNNTSDNLLVQNCAAKLEKLHLSLTKLGQLKYAHLRPIWKVLAKSVKLRRFLSSASLVLNVRQQHWLNYLPRICRERYFSRSSLLVPSLLVQRCPECRLVLRQPHRNTDNFLDRAIHGCSIRGKQCLAKLCPCVLGFQYLKKCSGQRRLSVYGRGKFRNQR